MKKFQPYYSGRDGRLTYRFVHRNKQLSLKQFSKTLSYEKEPSQRTLEMEYRKWVGEIEKSDHRNEVRNPMELLELYLNTKKEYAERYKYNLKEIKVALFPYKDITHIKKKDCLKIFETLKAQKNRDTTAYRIYAIFSAFLSWCAMMDYIEYNPSLRLQFKVRQNKRMGVLNREQKIEVLEKSKMVPHLHLAILIAMMTGMRRGEILALQWSWIDFANGTLRLPPENTKNKKGFYIALSTKLLEILKKERADRPQSTHVVEYCDKPIADNIKHSFDRLRKHLSFQYLADGERFTFHHLGHTFATELAQSGLPLVEGEKRPQP